MEMPADVTKLAKDVIAALKVGNMTIATAESCTGGLIAGALTSISGSSDVVYGGFVTYANEARIASLILGGKGLVRYLIVGVIGALVGGYVLKLTHTSLPLEGWLNDLVTAVIGSIIVLIIARIVAK